MRPIALILLACPVALADVAVFVTERDTTIYFPTPEPTSNGAGEFMFTGHTLRSVGERRALVRFELTGNLPPRAVVQHVSLNLHCSRTNAAPDFVFLHRVTSDWGEGASIAVPPGGQGTTAQPGDATWEQAFFPSASWVTPGGDFEPSPSAASIVPGVGLVNWTSTPQLVADVQFWADHPNSNFGWILISPVPFENNARRFDTRENANPANRPLLVVEYTVPCVADVDDGTGSGTPDLGVTIDDLLYYLALFENGDPEADVDDGTGTGTPDLGVTIDDLLYFLQRYEAGC